MSKLQVTWQVKSPRAGCSHRDVQTSWTGCCSWSPLRELKPLCSPALWFMQMRKPWRSPLPGQASIIHFLRVHVTMQIWALPNSPTGPCLSLSLPRSLGSASIRSLNGQGPNYSPHLSDQMQPENEENPRQAQPFLCCVLRGRGHPALSSRQYFPLRVSWPFWKRGTPALEIHYWASHIVCGIYTC